LLDAHNFVLVFGDIVVEELIKCDLKVLSILQIEALNKLLGVLFIKHLKDLSDVFLILNCELFTLLRLNLLLNGLNLLHLYFLALH